MVERARRQYGQRGARAQQPLGSGPGAAIAAGDGDDGVPLRRRPCRRRAQIVVAPESVQAILAGMGREFILEAGLEPARPAQAPAFRRMLTGAIIGGCAGAACAG